MLNIQIQTVSRCTGRCLFCPYPTSWHAKHPGVMTDDTFGHMMTLLQSVPLGKFCIYLENEPLCDKTLVEKIDVIKTDLDFEVLELSTNLSLLTPDLCARLYKSLRDVPHEIWISWHGVTSETYERLMGLSFERAVQGLRTYYQVTKGELNTVLRSISGDRCERGEQFSTPEECAAFFEQLLKGIGLRVNDLPTRIHTFSFHDRAGSIKSLAAEDEKLKEMIGRLKPDCWRIDRWLHILYDGDIILCCMDYQKEEIMGNILSSFSLEELFQSREYREVQKKATGEIETGDQFICKRCVSPGG